MEAASGAVWKAAGAAPRCVGNTHVNVPIAHTTLVLVDGSANL